MRLVGVISLAAGFQGGLHPLESCSCPNREQRSIRNSTNLFDVAQSATAGTRSVLFDSSRGISRVGIQPLVCCFPSLRFAPCVAHAQLINVPWEWSLPRPPRTGDDDSYRGDRGGSRSMVRVRSVAPYWNGVNDCALTPLRGAEGVSREGTTRLDRPAVITAPISPRRRSWPIYNFPLSS
jgi:hypothetical protein